MNTPNQNFFAGIVSLFLGLVISIEGVAASKTIGTRFVVVGHPYPIMEQPFNVKKLLRSINNEEVDYVFVLGDAELHQKRNVTIFKKGLEPPVFFSPGNHDLGLGKGTYLQSVGYLEKMVQAPDANFVLINTSESVEKIQRFLKKSIQKLGAKKNRNPVILMGHHRIWDDKFISERPYNHNKSYEFFELLPFIKGKVHSIFAGSAPRAYFGGPQNVNIVFWSGIFEGFPCYSAGMGDATPQATYVVGEFIKGKLYVSPRAVKIADSLAKRKKTPYESSIVKGIWATFSNVASHRYFWIGVLLSSAFSSALMLIVYVRSHNN